MITKDIKTMNHKDNMEKRVMLIMLAMMFSLAFISASLGTYKQGDCVDIKTILNTSSVTLSTLSYPDGSIAGSNIVMQNIAGKTFNYTFCNTPTIGTYVYDYYDADGEVYVNDFDITASGQSGTNNIVFIVFVIVLLYALTLIAFFGKSTPLTILGGMSMVGLGVYILQNGLIIYRDWITEYFGTVTWAVGAILALWALIEWIQDEFN
jgi:hypothetical protein